MTAEWTAQPHEPIQQLEENLWTVRGSLPGMAMLRTMTVARRTDGRLVLHSAIVMDEASMKEMESWGTPAFLVVPNGYHRLDAAAFKARYPEIVVLCPAAARKKVERLVQVDGTYEDFPPDEDVKLEYLDGLARAEGAMVVRSRKGTSVVMCDALFNMPHVGGLQGFVFRHVTGSSGGPRVSRIARWFVVKDKKAYRAELRRLAAIPDLVRVVVAHQEPIAGDVAGALRAVADTL